MTKTLTKSTSLNENNKKSYVYDLFSKIATKYDLLNNIMSFGMHKIWKEETIKLALKENNSPKEAIDLCTGTCDLAITLNANNPNIKITCIDNCSAMLEIGKNKLEDLNLKNISTLLLDSEELPFKESSIDLITIGFGLRNLQNKEKCIEDVCKILKPGGVFACIDLGHPTNKIIFKELISSYFFKIIPKLGQLFAKNKEAYIYLTNSLSSWYTQEELKDLLLKKGFKKCFYKNIMGGIIAIHIAVK